MSWRTTVILLVVAAVLGVLVWRQTESEDPDRGTLVVPLLADFDPARVVGLRIDNLERSLHMGLERDSGGRWYLTDPIAYPARREMLDQILQALRNDATRVAPAELAAADTHLDPPRAVIEVQETLPSGATQRRQVELGAVDLDGMRVYARVDGVILRTMRNLETPLEQHWQEWRSRTAFELDPGGIVEIAREGFLYEGENQTALELLAQLRGRSWWVDRPRRFLADPVAMGGWGATLATLRVDKFRSDVESPDLALFGLDNPWFRLTLVDRGGRSQTALVAVHQGAIFAKRADLPYVWEIEAREFARLVADPRDLFDRHLARVLRSEVEAIHVLGREHELRWTPEGEKRWNVSHRAPDGEWTAPRPANGEVVDRVLRHFEQTELVGYLWGDSIRTWLPEHEPVTGLWLESGGLRFGGRTGLVRRTEQGTEQLTFAREDEDVPSLLPLEAGELLTLTPLEAESLVLVESPEIRLTALRIALEGRTAREFLREVQGTWIYRDTPTQLAKEILPVLDYLTYLRAERHYPLEASEPLSDLVRVELNGAQGRSQVEVGRTASGEVRAVVGARQSKLAHPQVHELLLEIARKAQ